MKNRQKQINETKLDTYHFVHFKKQVPHYLMRHPFSLYHFHKRQKYNP